MDRALALAPASERLREGFLVAILGPPNAGKSTLLNRLARREAAIVSDEPGTTRDLIEIDLDLGGLPITLVDTAGLRESESAVERIGVARARARAGDADLILWLSEGGAEPAPDFGSEAAEVLRVATKADAVAASRGRSGALRPRRRGGRYALRRDRAARVLRRSATAARRSSRMRGSGQSSKRRAPVCARRWSRKRPRSSSPRTCASPPARSSGSPARWTSRSCST